MSKILSNLILEMCVGIISSAIIIAWYDIFCERKRKDEKFIFRIIIYTTIYIIMDVSTEIIMQNYFAGNTSVLTITAWVQMILEIALEVLLFISRYKGSMLKKIGLYTPFIFVIPTVEMYMQSIVNKELVTASKTNYYLEATNNVTLYIAFYLTILISSEVYRFIRQRKRSVHIFFFVIILGVQLVLHSFIEKIFLTKIDESVMSLRSTGYSLSAVILLCVGAIHNKYLKDQEYLSFGKERERTWKQQINYYQATSKTSTELRQIEHDLKKHLLVIGQMAQADKVEELQEYVQSIVRHTSPSTKIVDAQNTVVSAILTIMAARCEENDIDFQYFLQYKELVIADFDLSTILGNIMDNAFEASIQVDYKRKRFIQLSILEDRGIVLIVCRNYYSGEIAFDGKRIKTSKIDKNNHGIGINNIKKAVEKYDGKVELEVTEQIFEIHVTMQNHTQTQQSILEK